MPYFKCPDCGLSYRVNMSVKKVPEALRREVTPGRCAFCWQELNEGDVVLVRSSQEPGVELGSRGVITRIVSSEEGSLYWVDLDSGNRCFARIEIRRAPRDAIE